MPPKQVPIPLRGRVCRNGSDATPPNRPDDNQDTLLIRDTERLEPILAGFCFILEVQGLVQDHLLEFLGQRPCAVSSDEHCQHPTRTPANPTHPQYEAVYIYCQYKWGGAPGVVYDVRTQGVSTAKASALPPPSPNQRAGHRAWCALASRRSPPGSASGRNPSLPAPRGTYPAAPVN